MTSAANFATSTAGVVETGGNLLPVLLTLAVNLPPVSTKPVANNWNKLYVNSTTNLSPNKIITTFLIEDFFHLHLELRKSPRIIKKISKQS
jgi:hypothetical protein